MHAIGVDLSLAATGYCHADGRTETITPPRGTAGVERLVWLRDQILDRLPKLIYFTEPILVVLEGYSYNSKARGEVLGELGGIIRVALYEQGVAWTDVPPATLKKYATGRGNATKPDMRIELFKRAGIDERDDNAVDAWWLRQVGLCWLLGDDASNPVAPDVDGYVRMPADRRGALASVHFTRKGVPA